MRVIRVIVGLLPPCFLESLTALSTLCVFFLLFTLCSNAPEEDANCRIRLRRAQ